MAKRIHSHPAFTRARVAEMKALAKRIDAEEGEDIRARARAWKANRVRAPNAAVADPTNTVAILVTALKTARVEQGLTLDEVGERSGIQKASLAPRERPRAQPDLGHARPLRRRRRPPDRAGGGEGVKGTESV